MKTKLLLIILLAAFSVYGQQTDSLSQANVWTLKQCVDYALANNLTIKRNAYGVEGAQIDYRQSKWNMVPSLNGNISYGFSWGRTVNPVTYDFTTEEYNSLNPSLSSSVTLFNGFRIQNSIQQFNRSFHAAELDLEKAKNDVMLNIALLYINVIFNKEQLENARFQLSSSQAQLGRVRKQVAAGALPRSEELNMDAQSATNEVNVTTQENALALSLLQLKQALQLPASAPLDVEMIDVTIEDLILDQSRDQVYDIARQAMPEVKSANLKVESATYAMKASHGSLFPRLSLNASLGSNYSSVSDRRRFIQDGGDPTLMTDTIGYVNGTNQLVFNQITIPSGYIKDSYGYREQLKDNMNRSLGLTLSIPILNNLSARSSWQRSVINREIAVISAKETENQLRQDVETAYNNAIAASKTYNSSTRQVQAREEAFRMMEQRYNAGAANSFEYQVSQNDLFRAKSDQTRAKYDFLFRKKVLDFYQGKKLEY